MATTTHITINCTTGEQVAEECEITAPTTEELAATAAANQKRIIGELTAAVQTYLDATARSRSYDSILAACTYATSTITQYAAEGQACVQWRDACWFTATQILNAAAVSGNWPTEEQLIAELPPMVWPGEVTA